MRLALIPCVLAVLALPAAADTDRAHIVEQALRAHQPELRAVGRGVLRIFGLRIYEARLFASAGGLPPALAGQPYALDLAYARSFSARDIARRSREEMEKLGRGSATEREQWQAQLAALLPDVRKGDHLSGLYQPGHGTTFLYNGHPLGQMPGDGFARAFFAIWLDPHTSAPELRRMLLVPEETAR